MLRRDLAIILLSLCALVRDASRYSRRIGIVAEGRKASIARLLVEAVENLEMVSIGGIGDGNNAPYPFDLSSELTNSRKAQELCSSVAGAISLNINSERARAIMGMMGPGLDEQIEGAELKG